MTKRDDTSRREFIGLALSTAALSSLSPRELFAKGGAAGPGPQATAQREIPPLVDSPGWKEQGVENLTRSRHAKLRNIPVHAVTIRTGFWGRRRETNISKSILSMHDLLEANGRMTNFRRLIGKSQGAQSGPVYSDSDVYKWIEAAGFALQSGDRPELRATVEKLIGDVVSAQEPGGYLNTYYVNDHASPHASPDADDRPRTLQHGAHAAGRDRVLPRHWRPQDARCGNSFRKRVPDPQLRPRAQKTDCLRASRNRAGPNRALPHHR